jgi:CHC2 zinc finger
MMVDDPRLSEAKARPIADVVHLLGLSGLKRAGHELVGPCPRCGGTDRFGVNLRKGLFQCRRCEAKGDGLALVMWDRGLGFHDALTWLCGPATGIDDAERQARIAKARAAMRAAEDRAVRETAKVIADARRLWEQGQRPDGTAVEGYLARRSIDIHALGGFARCVRFHPDLPYAHHIDGRSQTIHRGPAMICAVQNAAGKFSALHRTYLDLDQPKGKALIRHPQTGEALDAKKGLGSKKGGAIRLSGARISDTLVMAEGIETTLSAWMGNPARDAMFWAGIDLGNMGGRKARGPGLRHAGLPDMDDTLAFLPPAGVTRLIFVMDGDSDPAATRATLESGLRRAMLARPGLRGQIVRAPDGKDLNDVLMGAKN